MLGYLKYCHKHLLRITFFYGVVIQRMLFLEFILFFKIKTDTLFLVFHLCIFLFLLFFVYFQVSSLFVAIIALGLSIHNIKTFSIDKIYKFF